MKRIVLTLLLVVMVSTLSVLALTGCNISAPTAVSLVAGTLPQEYDVDEAFPITAKLSVTYGTLVKKVALDASYVSGFDTGTSGEKIMTINYKGATADIPYKVRGSVNSRVRLAVSAEPAADSIKLTLRLVSLDTDGNGLYAMKTVLKFDSGALQVVSAAGLVDGWTLLTDKQDTQCALLYYDKTTSKKLTEDVDVVTLYVKKTYAEASVRLVFGGSGSDDYIEMSEGAGAAYLPRSEITI